MTVTTNYGFHQAQPSDDVDITAAVANPLQQVDTQLKSIEDAAAQVANNETVTGTWTFSTNPVLNAGAIAYAKLNLTGGVVNADVSGSAAIARSKLDFGAGLVNADIAAAAAIAYSKLSLTGAVVNGDISATAAIAYSKLSLTGSIVNADVSASAAIAKSKLASLAIVDADVSAISESKITNLTSDLSARLVAANNLSDVADVETSKANLRIPILRSVQAVATSNLTLSGTQTVDSYAAVANDRILATAQSTASQNGVWVVQSGAWTRPNDFPAAGTVLGRCVEVNGGTVYGGTLWILIATATITIDTTAQVWQLVGVSAGTGLTKTGNTLAVNYGTSGTTAAVGNDSRLSDARTPTAHASTHRPGGSDGIGCKFVFSKRTAGSLTLNQAATTTWADLGTADLVLTSCTAGDLVVVSATGLWNTEGPTIVVDVASIVSGSPVNYWGTAGGTTDDGIVGWCAFPGSAFVPIGGSWAKTLAAGDIAGDGSVTLRQRYRVNSGTSTNKTLFATSAIPLFWSAENKGAQV